MVWLYALILLLLAAALIGAYRVLGTPSRLTGRASRKYRTVASRPASRLVLGFHPNACSILRASTTERRCSPGRGGPCSSGWLLPVRRFNFWNTVLMSVSTPVPTLNEPTASEP